jgi:hypothetical protein
MPFLSAAVDDSRKIQKFPLNAHWTDRKPEIARFFHHVVRRAAETRFFFAPSHWRLNLA